MNAASGNYDAGVIGTILNVAGILLGGSLALLANPRPSRAQETWLKVTLGAFMVFYGLRLSWISFTGPFLHVIKQLLITLVAMGLGKAVGRLLGLQRFSNHAGRYARMVMERPGASGLPRAAEGFQVCSILFCAAPLAVLGALPDGLSGYFYPLALKGVIEGLGMFGFVRLFGPGVLLSALPVLAFQGSISLLALRVLQPFLERGQLLDSVNLVAGLLIFSVSLIVLELKKIEVADYLPSLLFAPLLTWIFR